MPHGTPAIPGTNVIDLRSSVEAKITLFRSLFRGRDDVYPRRFESRKTGKSGYQPACGKTTEAFLIRSDGNAKLWIIGNSGLGLEHGVYFYLDQLGCRWFFPNDHWTIIPSLKTITLKINRMESPVFQTRDFFGTGGVRRKTFDRSDAKNGNAMGQMDTAQQPRR